jgi:hypothetical protein
VHEVLMHTYKNLLYDNYHGKQQGCEDTVITK